MSGTEELNPYQPVVEVSDALPEATLEERPPLSLTLTAVRWFAICGFSALPSFFIAFQGSPTAALLLGIAVFASGYTALDYCTAKTKLRRNRRFARTLKITYGTRIIITVIFPAAMYLDIMCGLVSVSISSWIFSAGETEAIGTFFGAFFTTILQGLVMNAVLAVYALVVYGIQTVGAQFS